MKNIPVALAGTVAIGVLLATIIGMVLISIPTSAHAQQTCGKYDEMVATLIEKYGELRYGAGLTGATAVYEIYVSEETRSWTILSVAPNGFACVAAVGENWEFDHPTPGSSV